MELVDPPGRHTASGWAIEPDGLREVLTALTETYDPPPLYVDETGAAFSDVVAPDGSVHDQPRVDFLAAHVSAALDAVAQGVDLRGFFVWSLFDNFEWAEGYAHRFGIVGVDRSTLERVPKASARWFRQVADAR